MLVCDKNHSEPQGQSHASVLAAFEWNPRGALEMGHGHGEVAMLLSSVRPRSLYVLPTEQLNLNNVIFKFLAYFLRSTHWAAFMSSERFSPALPSSTKAIAIGFRPQPRVAFLPASFKLQACISKPADVHLDGEHSSAKQSQNSPCFCLVHCHLFINSIPRHPNVVQNSGLIPTLISTIWFT